MNRTTLIVLGLLLPPFLGWALASAIVRDPAEPNVEIFTEMSESYAAESQAANTVLGGNRVQLLPPEGTIYRGQLAEGVAWDEGERLSYLAGVDDPKELAGPQPTEASVARGEKGYAKYCQSCHGDKGQGNPALNAAGFPAPPNIVGGRATTLSEGELFAIVVKGQGKMQPMAERIPPRDLWAIVHHLRSMQGKGE
ncbi:MAG: cytochrome c [Planctomycetes bacterium]|nr:cytochrome c [Planctomycetota bacterium]